MTDEFKLHVNGKLIAKISDRVFVIVPDHADLDAITPLECPLCGMIMKTFEDAVSYRVANCCARCKLKWADARMAEWLNGWRPPEQEVQAEVVDRQKLPAVSS